VKRRRIFGFTLIELLVVVAIIALLISILLPSLSRARELSKRVVCSSNLSGVGKSCKIYANDNEEQWPVPAFDTGYFANGNNRVKYVAELPNPSTGPEAFSACVADPPRPNPSVPSGGMGGCNTPSTALSTTRAFWMLIRQGDVQPKGFICPSSGDTVDPTTEIDAYYDFVEWSNISYGYQVPFGPTQTRPSENLDGRMALAADKGPWFELSAKVPTTNIPNETSSPNDWRALNSGNHGGRGAGEGQNVLFQDGHASFERTPIVGVDQDNIYTLMQNNAQRVGRQIGKTPGEASPQHPFPGDRTFGGSSGLGNYASTDSLIYP
jgi:prepilin-type N-terminal cleavage/methylation domain-containing protein/prepilin-type processing-associated H-X9-DG protein